MPEITAAMVQGWIAEFAPRWPVLDENALREIAEACTRAHKEQATRAALPRDYQDRLHNLRASIKDTRDGVDMILRELPSLWQEAEGFSPAAIEALEQVERALRRLRPFLVARPRGGQPNAWGPLAEFIADHLRLALHDHRVRASQTNEVGPLARVVAAAVNAVFGKDITTARAIANVLRRRQKARRTRLAAPIHQAL